MSEDKELNDLAVMLPLPKKLVIAGEEVDVSPLKLGEIVRIGAALKAIKSHFNQDKKVSEIALELLTSDDANYVLDALAVLIRKNREWVDNLSLDEAVEVLAAVLGNNVDVFQKKVIPAILQFSNRVQAQVQSA